MSDDPLRTSALIPDSLCMRVSACFYCGNDNYDDVSIQYLYGIRTCPEHKAWAERDCRAECHRTNKVPLSWIASISKLAPLLEKLKDYNLSVRRSSGEIQSGWFLGSTSNYEPDFIQKCGDVWTLPLINLDKELTKRVSIQNLLQENPELNVTVFEEAERVLEDGVFKADFDAHTALARINTTELPEEPCVGMALFQDRIVRAAMWA